MREAFDDALVSGWEELEGGLSLPDQDDRHVLGIWVTPVPPRRDPGALRAASMIMSAVACAARWAALGRTLV